MMKQRDNTDFWRRTVGGLGGSLTLAASLLFSVWATLQVQAIDDGFGYGMGMAQLEVDAVRDMGFNWIKLYPDIPAKRWPLNVLFRVDADASHLADVAGFGEALYVLARDHGHKIDAYEIGNEPNLDASYGWAAPPNAADYAVLLCEAYGRIKAVDPAARIVSAGLAPTGRVSGTWQGHPGHNGQIQDEREFFLEFLAAGGHHCLDGIGYHPYGFRANYDADPDIFSTDPNYNCVNGFCFRGAEKMYDLMAANGLTTTRMWATELGWVTPPPEKCFDDPTYGWEGRMWQIVTETKQATNLVGAFEYAAAEWPWMQAMFVFNYNFNTAPWYELCESMRFYSVKGRPAEAALTAMPKVVFTPTGQLAVTPLAVTRAITVGQQPLSQTGWLRVVNEGKEAFAYTITAVSPASPTLVSLTSALTGTLSPTQYTDVAWQMVSISRPLGVYTATFIITTTAGVKNSPQMVPVTLYILDKIHYGYLPLVRR